MSLFYRLAYAIGFAPWERAAEQEAAAFRALFDREQAERAAPGRALDLGCGTGLHAVELAGRGWQVTGIDNVPAAVRAAHERAARAGVEARFLEGDVTRLRDAGVGSGFDFLLDLGCYHGLDDPEREAMARELTAVAAPGATLLLLAWAPGRRGPLPRGVDRAGLEAAFPEWRLTHEDALDVTALPRPLRRVAPRCYRLRRA